MRTHQANSTSTPNNLSASSRALLAKGGKKKLPTTYEGVTKRRRRNKPGTVALKQIKFYQKTTNLLLRNLPFARLVREIANECVSASDAGYRWKASAIEALQCACETYLVALFTDINKAAIHGKRVTIRPEDLHLVKDIRGSVDEHERF